MTKTNQKNIEVFAHWQGLSQPIMIGTLHAIPSRGKEIFSFEYSDSWLATQTHALDPALQLYTGQQYPSNDQENFGIFLDSSPDRWGRALMNKREVLLAKKQNRPAHKLLSSDYLLGVFDENRMGALRFRMSGEGPFLDYDKTLAAPPWTSLRELEHASLELENENAESKASYAKWIHMLIAPGGSLGGARPKASVLDEKNQLWIAKFPSQQDEDDIGAWEMLAFRLAKQSGITVAEAKLDKFGSKHHTFLNKRFDRTASNERVHFASAMTLLQRSDGDDWTKGASYLELAEFIIQHGAQPAHDLEQLWKRILFNICISNVDDHLRNHGFLLQPNKGWILSPAYDLNPVPDGDGLKLNISEDDNSQDVELVLSVKDYFRIKSTRAAEIIEQTMKITKQWRREASKLGISEREQEKMGNAFKILDKH